MQPTEFASKTEFDKLGLLLLLPFLEDGEADEDIEAGNDVIVLKHLVFETDETVGKDRETDDIGKLEGLSD